MSNRCSPLACRLTWCAFAVAGLAACGAAPRVETPSSWPTITLTPTDRILVLAPHPDDEVLACGGIIQQAVAMHLPLRIVFLTYGDNNEWSFLIYRKGLVVTPGAVQRMGLVRHDEAVAASAALGVAPEALTFLGYPDFGTLHIWKSHWGDRRAFRSMLTRVKTVPYPNAFRPGAAYKGEEILHDLTQVLREFRPTKVFVSHPGDHMPDHAALYLFTRVALWDLAGELQPQLHPYLIHFKRWPRPRGDQPTRPLEPPAMFRDQVAWVTHQLRPEEVERKRSAIRAHRSQYNTSARDLLSFIRPNELFGDFPTVVLRPAAPLVLSGSGRKNGQETDEQLTDQERAAFVGFEERSVRLDDGFLVISITFSRPLGKTVSASVFIFGYRADRPFGQMPKLHLKFDALGRHLYDQDRLLTNGAVQISQHSRQLLIRVPLELLGDPQRILTSARTSLGEVPLDWVSWRALELPSAVPAGSF